MDCDDVRPSAEAFHNQDSLESRMLGNLHVRFGVGAGVKLPRLHHLGEKSPRATWPDTTSEIPFLQRSYPTLDTAAPSEFD